MERVIDNVMWYIEMGGMYNINNQKIFGRKIYIHPNKKSEIRKRFNNIDVYATILSYDNKNQNDSNLYGPMYLDLDLDIQSENDYQLLKSDIIKIVSYLESFYDIPYNYIKFYFTGKKGFHLIIEPNIFNLLPDKKLNIYYKEIAKELNNVTITKLIDTKIYDNKRLFRLTNSINSKTGLYKVPISYNQIINMSFEDIKSFASSPKPLIKIKTSPCEKAIQRLKAIKEEIEKTQNRTKNKDLNIKIKPIENIEPPSCIYEIMENGAKEGNRNNTTIILASSFFQNGASYKDTLDLVSNWNEIKNDPPLPQLEINTTVASAYQQVKSGRRYGCNSIKDCGLCVGDDCKLFK